MSTNHIWKFFRAGGFDQVRLETGADLLALDELDQKLWVALACPTTGLEFDSKTLAMIDTDKDGRIRVPELIAALKWTGKCLKNPDDLLKGGTELPLSAISESTPEGRDLLASARHILVSLGKKGADSISLEDTADTAKIFVQTHFNGDGIVPIESADEEAIREVIKEIIACFGAETDRSGRPGINQAKADQFFKEATAYADWWVQHEADSAIRSLGDSTAAAFAAFKTVRAKVCDYFARCQLAAFDPRASNALNREEKEYLALAAKDLTLTSAEIAGLPLAQVGANKPLPLGTGVNPAWAAAIEQLKRLAIEPILGSRTALSESDWATLESRFAPYEAWLGSKPATVAEKLGTQRIRQIVALKAKEKIDALIAKDKALEKESNAITQVEQLIRYHRDIYRLATNFVSFQGFYSRKEKAIFQAGTLYLDQRSCDLCLYVQDAAKHAAMAGLAGTYLAYCNCTRKGTNETCQVVAAFTDGDSDNLMVGRNGVFYDRKGRDWDATIVSIVDNPISIRQAFWSPYKKAIKLIRDQITKRASEANDTAVNRLSGAAGPAAAAPASASKPADAVRRIDPGLIAALSVGMAGIGGMIGAIVSGFLGLGIMMPLGVIGVILLISGPSMLLAWFKLHKRNLGPILDANGWAVNAKARVNVPFGASLTRVAVLPPGAQRDLVDPFADKKYPWKAYTSLTILLLAVVFGLVGSCRWYRGDYDSSPMLPTSLSSTNVLGANAPALKRLRKAEAASTNQVSAAKALESSTNTAPAK
jgi:hypothetical protein